MCRRFQYTFFLSAFLFCFGVANANRLIVQAENMQLFDYKSDSQGEETFVKLTNTKGKAKFNFAFPSGRYNIDVRYLSEKIGQNKFSIFLNNIQIVSWLGKNQDGQWHLLSEQRWHIPTNMEINRGDEIRIETLSEKGSLGIFDYIVFTPFTRLNSSTKQNIVTIFPNEYQEAIRNPLKGFRPSFGRDHEYGTLSKSYIKWNEIENSENDGADKIKEFCNIKWKGCKEKNLKYIPRVYLSWPKRENGWPSDMIVGKFTGDQFKRRVVALIKKLGEAWDQDSRVAYVEIGIIGEWGEMEYPDTDDEIKEAISAQFAASFQHKLVMIRWPNTYNDDLYNFGYYWDSWAHYDQRYYVFSLKNTSSRWKTAVIGGEAAYDWGNYLIQPGRNPNESLSNPIHRDYIVDQIRTLHANHMGWIASYDQNNKNVKSGAEIVQKAMGYRFVISEVNYSKKIDRETNLMVSFKVKNTGSSPFYYNWPVEISLLDPKTKQPVWKTTYTNVDIRNWLPGDKWDDKKDTYIIQPDTYTVTQSFGVPEIPSGDYIVALAILDPDGNQPCVRFAITNYYRGGRHPIGRIGVKKSIESFLLSDFDDIQNDNTLFYGGD